MEYLKVFILNEYKNGNFVIAGGDWNQCPPDLKSAFQHNQVNQSQMTMAQDYLPSDWKWVYDNSTPTNRTVITSYDPSATTTTVIMSVTLN